MLPRPSFTKSHSFWVALTAISGLKVDEITRERLTGLTQDLSPTALVIAGIVVAYLIKRGLVESAHIKALAESSHARDVSKASVIIERSKREVKDAVIQTITNSLASAGAHYPPSPFTASTPAPEPEPKPAPVPIKRQPRAEPIRRQPVPPAPTPREITPRPDERIRTDEPAQEDETLRALRSLQATSPYSPPSLDLTKGHFLASPKA